MNTPDSLRNSRPKVLCVIALELHQEKCVNPRVEPGFSEGLLADEVEEAPVEQLYRRGVVGSEVRNHFAQGAQGGELYPHTAPAARDVVEFPFDLGDYSQGSFGSDDQVDHVARGEIFIERIAGRILASLWKAAPDEGRCDLKGPLHVRVDFTRT